MLDHQKKLKKTRKLAEKIIFWVKSKGYMLYEIINKRDKMVKKKKVFGGMKIVPDVKLGEIIGKAAVTPAEMTKKIWEYIKKKKLLKK